MWFLPKTSHYDVVFILITCLWGLLGFFFATAGTSHPRLNRPGHQAWVFGVMPDLRGVTPIPQNLLENNALLQFVLHFLLTSDSFIPLTEGQLINKVHSDLSRIRTLITISSAMYVSSQAARASLAPPVGVASITLPPNCPFQLWGQQHF